jgi:hypothetical protein
VRCGIAYTHFPLSLTFKINVIFFLGLLAVVEGVSFLLLLHGRVPIERVYRDHSGAIIKKDRVIEKNKEMGYQLPANIQVSTTATRDGQLVYSSNYSTDAYNRRIAPKTTAIVPDKYVVFFGGSNTFGEGVNDDETLPHYLSRLAPSYRPYNYGVSGYGTQHMLAKFQTTDLRQQIHECDGIAVYGFINDHVDRVINRMKNNWVHQSPYYFLNSEGILERNGTFNTARPILYIYVQNSAQIVYAAFITRRFSSQFD